ELAETVQLSASAPALELRNLDVVYQVRGKDRQVLHDVSLTIERGRSYGLVGESGGGKSTAALAIIRYLPRNGPVSGGQILVGARNVVDLSGTELRRMRAADVGMVYQNPGAALNPGIRVGRQVAEVFAVRGVSKTDASMRAVEVLRTVQIADPESV